MTLKCKTFQGCTELVTRIKNCLRHAKTRHSRTHAYTDGHPSIRRQTDTHSLVQYGETALLIVAKKEKSKEKKEMLELMLECNVNAELSDNVN